MLNKIIYSLLLVIAVMFFLIISVGDGGETQVMSLEKEYVAMFGEFELPHPNVGALHAKADLQYNEAVREFNDSLGGDKWERPLELAKVRSPEEREQRIQEYLVQMQDPNFQPDYSQPDNSWIDTIDECIQRLEALLK